MDLPKNVFKCDLKEQKWIIIPNNNIIIILY